ncbi:LysM peptidoglycan-binding domain-containing protein [Lysinibacillus piscis]|uniref:LysM domain-containing protein n=1 Tax=Lysinibacillus piscis TaxID=2518931 RepID=A0ABQ5NG54_9BACI|nr:LysM peptidoglycan-binding domain-containing protein [Lysinibacillus sp. KH24]GLC87093.1 hypothetical protein LYSBPC_02200 [Lysinibacillus sp. KH24]
MSKEDYRDKMEEHRQSFEGEEQETLSRVSRMDKNGDHKKKPTNKKRRFPLMTVLFIIFILCPASVLLYFVKFYEPGKPIEEVEKQSDAVIEVGKVDEKATPAEEKQNEQDEKDNQAAVEQAKKDAEKLAAQQKAAEEAKKAEEARIAQQKQAEAEAAKKAEEARKAEEAKQAAKASTHTVKTNENLYRIALNHYGDGSETTLAKIRAANGMASNDIYVGQVIKLP